ncbi:MAG: zinc-dependent peptidase [Elainellaceae cyanobacterium]
MVEALVAFLLIGLIIAGILAHPVLIRCRRDRLKRRPFPPQWAALLDHHLPIYARLSSNERHRLQGHIQILLAEKQFIGCAGVQITDEIRVTIAAIACLLLLNERGKYFPKLRSILVYPGAYFATETTPLGQFLFQKRKVARLGESWSRDQLVLSWKQIQDDTQQWHDGRNVVLHEFAHQLDQENGSAEGVPVLTHAADYSRWAAVMTDAYHRFSDDAAWGDPTSIDRYGAKNPAEFFAVVTETFFEKPCPLMNDYPALYNLLQDYYRLNPLQWS